MKGRPLIGSLWCAARNGPDGVVALQEYAQRSADAVGRPRPPLVRSARPRRRQIARLR